MSLVAWYPLTKDCKNYGTDGIDLSQKGTNTFLKGKLGNALTYETAAIANRFDRDNFPKVTGFSWAVWVKTNSFTGNPRYAFTQGRADVNSDGWGLGFSGTSDHFMVRYGNMNYGVPYTPDEWTHLAFSIDDNKVAKIYKNGELIRQETPQATPDYSEGNGKFTLGCFGYISGHIYPMTGAICDFRYYDHALSKSEIKEISKGLVCHLPLNNNGEGRPNLLIGSERYTKDSPLTRTKAGIDGWQRESTLYTERIEAGTYTLQAETDGVWHAHSTPSGGYDPSYRYCSIWLVSAASENDSEKDINICFGATVPNKVNLSYGGTYHIRTNLYSNGTDSMTINFWNFKLEREDTASVFSPYSTNNIEYDVSGFENNCTIVNSPVYTSDTPVYDVGMNFNQTGYLKTDSFGVYADKFTVSFWLNPSDSIVSQHFLMGTHNNWTNNGFAMWRDTTGGVDGQYYYSVLYRSPEEENHGSLQLIVDTNKWTYVTFVYDGTTCSLYKNGVLFKAGTYGKGGEIYHPVLYLGTGRYGNLNTETDESIMSDFRFYATAFTAEDVMNEYKSKAKIDKNGNMYCKQYIEEHKQSLFMLDNGNNAAVFGNYAMTPTYDTSKFSENNIKITWGRAIPDSELTASKSGFYWQLKKSVIKNFKVGSTYLFEFDIRCSKTLVGYIGYEFFAKFKNVTVGTDYQHISLKVDYTREDTTEYGAFVFYFYGDNGQQINIGDWMQIRNFHIYEQDKEVNINKKGLFFSNDLNEQESMEEMMIKELDDGSVWARIFWHDVSSDATYFTNEEEAKSCNKSNRYSNLKSIGDMKYNGDYYEFMLCYPQHSTTKYNRWIQTVNPLETRSNANQTALTMGYEAVHIDFTTYWYYGMGLCSNSLSFLDCEAGHNNWFGAIGQYGAHSGGMPAPIESGMNQVQSEVELWVRVDDSFKSQNKAIIKNTFIKGENLIEN